MKAVLLGLLQSGNSTILSAVSGKALPAPGSVGIEDAMQASIDRSDLENPMGETRKDAPRVNFSRKSEFSKRI